MKPGIAFIVTLLLACHCQAQQLAATGTPLTSEVQEYTLYIFTGSDWCMNCRRLEKKVTGDPAFAASMKLNGIEIRIVDFPQRKKLDPSILKYNQAIADKYHFEGIYPSLVLAKNDSEHFRLFYYKNQDRTEFSGFILETKAKLNE
jgi:thiol-disulfide isomerase/thioredoxin